MIIDDDYAEALALSLVELSLVDYSVLILASSLALLLSFNNFALELYFSQLSLRNHRQDNASGHLPLL